ncbi:TlpA disulfide reductase family protein [Flavobacterium enshiense]|uniref:TlpA family protein disulfide reductase n=1 Tax=Flavobacterium enshiense TaxID=1341165 RepID=UPI00345DD377
MRIFYFIFLLLVTISHAQKIDKQAIIELDKLHSRTNFIRDSIGILIKSQNAKIKEEINSDKTEFLMLSLDSLYNVSDKNDIEELKTDINYCIKNPSCSYSFNLVYLQVARQRGKNFYKEFEYVYNNSSKEIKESETGKKMAEKLKFFKQSMVGSVAPKFSGVDIYKQDISLQNFYQKKYVLIDFWASWCAPCREEIPFLKSLKEKYKAQDFEIISISIDEDLKNLENAITKEKIEDWKHFSTLQNNSSIKQEYFVNGIPHKVLIDKNGIIIGKWKASGELNKKELENQLIQIFGY